MGFLDRLKKQAKLKELEGGENLFPSADDDVAFVADVDGVKPTPKPTLPGFPELADALGDINALAGEYPLAGEDEKAIARALRDRSAETRGVKSRLEPFYLRPMLGAGSMVVLSAMYLIVLVFYLAYTPLALALLLVFFPLGAMLVSGRKEVAFLLPKKVAYNVVAVKPPSMGTASRTLIFTGNYDGKYGTNYSGAKLKKLVLPFSIFSLASLFAQFVFCITVLALGAARPTATGSPAAVGTLTAIPLILGIAAIFFTATYTSWDKRNIIKNNLQSATTALGVFQYFAARPEALPEGTRLVYLALSAKNNGNTGAFAFIKQHKERSKDGLLENATVIEVGDIVSKDLTLVGFDLMSMTEADKKVSDALRKALDDSKKEYAVLENKQGDLLHHSFAAFCSKGISAGCVSARKIANSPFKEAGEQAPLDADTGATLMEILAATAQNLYN